MIIYPPFIADTIPAFTNNKIIIPFQENQAVARQQVTGFRLIVKDYQSSKIEATLSINKDEIFFINNEIVFTSDLEKGFATTKPDEYWIPTMSQYYKFQLAYDDGTDYFAYSSASIGRCIGITPTIKMCHANSSDELLDNQLNISKGSFKSEYSTDILSEPVYSYRFTLKDEDDNIIQDTGEVLHNANESQSPSRNKLIITHNFVIKYELELYKKYKLQYSITTINGYKASTPEYYIIKAVSIPPIFTGKLVASQNEKAKSNGYIDIQIQASNNDKCRGNFVLERTSDEKFWDEITTFEMGSLSELERFYWKDNSVEHGKKYRYSLRQYAMNRDGHPTTYSNRILTDWIAVEFEDMFLSDGERQLKIEYNPKVSSFKNTILEQKMDTIGSQYPFFFRNNIVKYKEIPISGLISYHMDKDNYFLNKDIEYSTDLTNDNIAAEREFKLEVLEWLTNGEPKLFRSPAEGNYVVRLMNTSLSPNDSLGRMLHSFTSTGYEVDTNDKIMLLENGTANYNPIKVSKTLDLNWFNSTDKIEGSNAVEFVQKNIEQIYWYAPNPIGLDPQNPKCIQIDGELYYSNASGVFTTPAGMYFNSIIITEDDVADGGYITCVYEAAETLRDEFSNRISNITDALLSIPMGKTLWGDVNGIMYYEDSATGEKVPFQILHTYSIRAMRDPNAAATDDFKLYIGDEEIDCSYGVKYFENLDGAIHYEKGTGLHLEIYVNIEGDFLSSELGKFILGKSKLGG